MVWRGVVWRVVVWLKYHEAMTAVVMYTLVCPVELVVCDGMCNSTGYDEGAHCVVHPRTLDTRLPYNERTAITLRNDMRMKGDYRMKPFSLVMLETIQLFIL